MAGRWQVEAETLSNIQVFIFKETGVGKENTVKTFSKISKVYWDFGGKTRGDDEVLVDFKDGKLCPQVVYV